jgi:hypothetical protein
VSPNGLVATNHHCVRGAVSRTSRAGENLLDHGFYAATLDDERPIERFYADQLIAIEDVTDEVRQAADLAAEEHRGQARAEAFDRIRERGRQAYSDRGDSIWVEVVSLYNGGRHSAYVFRRFTDVRLVQAVELEIGFFGGDPDNFTYPRYALDFAFLRVYENGAPYRPEHHFGWSEAGVEEGDVVFVIGNPGQTNRLRTIAQLEYQQSVQVPALIGFLESRLEALGEYRTADPAEAEALGIRNRMFSLSNSLKASTGRREALEDSGIMARKRDAERQLRDSLRADPELASRYGWLFDRLEEIQAEKASHAAAFAAFLAQTNQLYASSTLRRALTADALLQARAAGAPPDTLELLRLELERIGDHPAGLEKRLLAARFADFERYFGPDHAITVAALQGAAPEAAASALLAASVLSDSAATVRRKNRPCGSSPQPSRSHGDTARSSAGSRRQRPSWRRSWDELDSPSTAGACRRMGPSRRESRMAACAVTSTTAPWRRRTRPSTGCTTATSATRATSNGRFPRAGASRRRGWISARRSTSSRRRTPTAETLARQPSRRDRPSSASISTGISRASRAISSTSRIEAGTSWSTYGRFARRSIRSTMRIESSRSS